MYQTYIVSKPQWILVGIITQINFNKPIHNYNYLFDYPHFSQKYIMLYDIINIFMCCGKNTNF